MKDELRIFCRLEGWDEEHLRARIKAEKRLERAGKRREAERTCRESGFKEAASRNEKPAH